MKKKITTKKQENIEKAGPDDPSFVAWSKENSSLHDMGCENINQASYADDECPDDAIQVDVFKVSQVRNEFTKGKFYTEAEAPTFMKK